MGNGEFGGLVDAALNVKFIGAVAKTNRTSAAWFAAGFLRAGIELKTGGAAFLMAARAKAVEVDPFTPPLG